ncbi:Putative cytochrome P450 133B1 [Paraburkholderia caribensis]|uniref:cytochrome P450 n=1 Tax=Paraburkholderia caribensis TaxID=75105 RepID=UPI001CB4E78A|nr:cytochrome P450 [Paraburkholderia caribensis]CAG9211240.1 Putative cytochrome P450 133B1 [Paraburkholderia caribensis]
MKFTDLSSPAYFDNPYPFYEGIRGAGAFVPLAPSIMLTGRHAVIDALLPDRRMGKTYMPSVVARYGESAREQPVFQALERTFLMMNPPAHTRLRALLMKAFNARQIETLRAIAEETTDSLIDAMQGKPEVDLVSEFAMPLPLQIICRLLDVPVEDGVRFGDAASLLVSAFDLAPMSADALAHANQAALDLEQYFRAVIAQRRAAPGHDIVSSLIQAEEGGERLSEDEIVSNVILLFVAGHETTSNMLGNALIALHRHPAQLERLRGDPSLVSEAVAECARYDTAVQMVVRTAFDDIEVEGQTLPRGSIVFMLLGSANRDPERFDAPDTLDIGREPSGHLLTFGAGIHYCLGARLAMMELEIALHKLLTRLPQLRLTNLDALQWRRRNNLRGVETLLAAL